MTDFQASYFYRIPNEYGTPNAIDLLKMAANKAYSVALDPYGNLYTSTASNSATYYNVLMRAYPYITQAPITKTTSTGTMGYEQAKFATSISVGSSTEVFSSSALGLVTLSNSGNQAPTYTQPSGYQLLGSVDAFSLSWATAPSALSPAMTVPSYATCSFATGLPRGQQCYVPITFAPTTPGVVSSMNIQFPSDATYTSVMTIVGTAKGTAASTASNLAVSVTSPSGSIYPTESITLMATVASAATGTVTLMVDGINIEASELASGSVSFKLLSGLAAGSHTIGVTYAGDATYAPVTTPVTTTVTVVKIPSTAALVANGNQANVGQAIILTGTVATASGYAEPSGTMTFYDGSTAIGTATVTNGVGSLTVSSLAVGTHTVTSTYNGDSLYASVTSANSVQIVVGNYKLSQTALTVTPSVPAGGYAYGTTLTLTAQVSAVSGSTAPTGLVVFSLDGSVLSAALNSSGLATATVTPHAGSHVLIASYAGDTNFAFSNSSTYSFTTVKAVTTALLKASTTAAYASSPITFTATVSSSSTTPTGTVTFMNGASTLSTVTLSSGVAALTTQNLPAGTDSVIAIYAGNSDSTSSTSSTVNVAITINATTVTVSSVPLIVYSGQPKLTATIGYTDPSGSTVTPSGTVTFSANGAVLGTIALGAGGSAACTPGSATCTTTLLPSGVNTITASYSGDNYFAASATTSTYLLYVAPSSGWGGTYTITASPATATVTTGSSTSITLTASSSTNYFGYVQITCSGLPSFASCQLANDQILLNGTNTPVSTTLVIYTTSSGEIVMNKHNHTVEVCSLSILSILPLVLCGFMRKGRKFLRRIGAGGIVALLLLSLGFGSMTACCGLSPIATGKGTYTVTVNAVGSGGVNTSANVQLTVQ
jgi:hypothetical protein